jgi:hypothetical protein
MEDSRDPYIRFMERLSDSDESLLRQIGIGPRDLQPDINDSSVDAPTAAHGQSLTTAGSETMSIVICMSREASHRLASARFVQSDISFKRVAGFLEFELGGMDPFSKTCACIIQLEAGSAKTLLLGL